MLTRAHTGRAAGHRCCDHLLLSGVLERVPVRADPDLDTKGANDTGRHFRLSEPGAVLRIWTDVRSKRPVDPSARAGRLLLPAISRSRRAVRRSEGLRTMSAITIETVSKSYGKNAVLHGSICDRDGEFVSFLGPSGCGKSTFLFVSRGSRRYQRVYPVRQSRHHPCCGANATSRWCSRIMRFIRTCRSATTSLFHFASRRPRTDDHAQVGWAAELLGLETRARSLARGIVRRTTTARRGRPGDRAPPGSAPYGRAAVQS